MNDPDVLPLVSDIVAAHVANNEVAASDLPGFITAVHAALAGLGQPTATEPQADVPIPATTVRKSLANPDKLLSMIDGKPYSSLKRHITRHGFTPQSYREAYGLKPDYPMVAPGYSARRSDLAQNLGLGRKPNTAAPEPAKGSPTKRGRKPNSLKAAIDVAREHLSGKVS